MIKLLHVPKQFGTYADTFLLLGLAKLAARAQQEICDRTTVQIQDLGTEYQIILAEDLDPDEIADLLYWSLFRLVKGGKTKIDGLPIEEVEEQGILDTVNNAQERSRYRKWKADGGKKTGEPEPQFDSCTQNGVILTSMRHDANHNNLWLEAWNLKPHFGALVAAILQAFASEETANVMQRIAALFKQRTGQNLPAPASAVKIFMPTAVQGVNRVKADNNTSSGSQKEEWGLLWLIAAGLFEYGLSERVKVAENTYDWRVLGLMPKDIDSYRYGIVLNELRKSNPPSGAFGVARFDAETVLRFCQQLLNHHPAKDITTEPIPPHSQRRRASGRSLKQLVSGFSGTHFNSKGQVYGVKEIFSLGVPDWIRPSNQNEIIEYQKVLDEHLKVVRSLSADEGHSELLAAYRDFITSSDLYQFFRFQVSYADYVVKKLADPKAKYPPRLFSQEILDIMTDSFRQRKDDQEWSLTEITEDPGFLRIARAINSATVYAGKIQTKGGAVELDWQRNYGLAQRLSSQAGSKKDFIIELMTFLSSYENENLRLSEQLQKDGKTLRRIWTTNEDLDRVIALIEKFGSNLVANLLITYGYSRWKKTISGDPGETLAEDENSAKENLEDAA
jgi:hypothetical protein